jgi:hypothetical protein
MPWQYFAKHKETVGKRVDQIVMLIVHACPERQEFRHKDFFDKLGAREEHFTLLHASL